MNTIEMMVAQRGRLTHDDQPVIQMTKRNRHVDPDEGPTEGRTLDDQPDDSLESHP